MNINFDFQGLNRRYIVHVPPSDKPLPLVLVLHGAGGNAEATMRKYRWVQEADKEGFAVAFPEATPLYTDRTAQFMTNPTIWNDDGSPSKVNIDDIGYLRKVIEDISQKYPIDPSRIYMSGFSNGASMSFKAGIEMSDVIASIAPLAGIFWSKNPRPLKSLSVLLIAGDADPFIPINGGEGLNIWGREKFNNPPMIESILNWLPLIGVNESQNSIIETDTIKTLTYGPSMEGLKAIYTIVKGQGHEWPGGQRALPEDISGKNVQTFNATHEIWMFFNGR